MAKINSARQIELISFEKSEKLPEELILNKNRFLETIESLISSNDLMSLKLKISKIRSIVLNPKDDDIGLINSGQFDDVVLYSRSALISILDKIISSQTIERANHYLKQLYKSLLNKQTNEINDINLSRWREYDEIITDSLWIFDKRDTSGAHLGWYWGNFIPQIPRQLMLRYTKKGDWVLDSFLGSGTTLIECRRLGRNGIGIELNQEVAKKAKELIEKEQNKYNVITEVIVGDSRTIDINKFLINIV
jgi:hypothetical protein